MLVNNWNADLHKNPLFLPMQIVLYYYWTCVFNAKRGSNHAALHALYMQMNANE